MRLLSRRPVASAVAVFVAMGAFAAFRAAKAAEDPAEQVRDVLTRSDAAFERGDMAALDRL